MSANWRPGKQPDTVVSDWPGDCGFYDVEKDEEVIQARQALAKAEKKQETA